MKPLICVAKLRYYIYKVILFRNGLIRSKGTDISFCQALVQPGWFLCQFLSLQPTGMQDLLEGGVGRVISPSSGYVLYCLPQLSSL
jgi:hypothetical protein